ncbi:PepSY domain-containing protein [Novosphingobium resinovorum]
MVLRGERRCRLAPPGRRGHARHDVGPRRASRHGNGAHGPLTRRARCRGAPGTATGLRRSCGDQPPTAPEAPWQVRSQAENRPRRDSAEIASDGGLIGVERFADRHWIDRTVGYGVAIHEGAWAGLANQLVNLAILFGLVLLCVSSMVLWWRRRPTVS